MAEEKKPAAKKAAAPKAEKAPAAKAAPAKKAAAAKSGKKLKVTQVGSPIGRVPKQEATLVGLGLNKLGRRRTLKDSPQVRGMIAKVAHMVRVVEDTK